MLIIGIIVLAITSLGGALLELNRVRRKRLRTNNTTRFKVTPKNLRNEERYLEDELYGIMHHWEVLHLMTTFTIRGQFTKTSKTHPSVITKLVDNCIDTSSRAVRKDEEFVETDAKIESFQYDGFRDHNYSNRNTDGIIRNMSTEEPPREKKKQNIRVGKSSMKKVTR